MSEFDELRGFDDEFDDDPGFGDEFMVEEEAARAGGPLGMSPAELAIGGIFVLLNAVAFVVILLIILGVFAI